MLSDILDGVHSPNLCASTDTAQNSTSDESSFAFAYGADPNVIAWRGRTCLIDVVNHDSQYYNEYHYEIVKLLVEYGTDISIKDQDGFTAYDYAVKYNRTELYDLLKP